ncbi:hypothetical protein CWI39_0015p0030 [Hamiltosporidium magnivora]|uniref:Uncharacterized protein n=1 Tax=Hamiltosporidium magnivora TaxID=148818 RepID=A0A4Q9LR92_9MICR|nr:hypothetical protein CWI39_0015p0030 [Hamiltosporidium magnivora]
MEYTISIFNLYFCRFLLFRFNCCLCSLNVNILEINIDDECILCAENTGYFFLDRGESIILNNCKPKTYEENTCAEAHTLLYPDESILKFELFEIKIVELQPDITIYIKAGEYIDFRSFLKLTASHDSIMVMELNTFFSILKYLSILKPERNEEYYEFIKSMVFRVKNFNIEYIEKLGLESLLNYKSYDVFYILDVVEYRFYLRDSKDVFNILKIDAFLHFLPENIKKIAIFASENVSLIDKLHRNKNNLSIDSSNQIEIFKDKVNHRELSNDGYYKYLIGVDFDFYTNKSDIFYFKGIFRFEKLTRLNINLFNTKEKALRDYNFIDSLKSLKNIRFINLKITNKLLKNILNCKKLKSLYFKTFTYNKKIDPNKFNILNTSIVYLNFKGLKNSLDRRFFYFLERCKSLQHLIFTDIFIFNSLEKNIRGIEKKLGFNIHPYMSKKPELKTILFIFNSELSYQNGVSILNIISKFFNLENCERLSYYGDSLYHEDLNVFLKIKRLFVLELGIKRNEPTLNIFGKLLETNIKNTVKKLHIHIDVFYNFEFIKLFQFKRLRILELGTASDSDKLRKYIHLLENMNYTKLAIFEINIFKPNNLFAHALMKKQIHRERQFLHLLGSSYDKSPKKDINIVLGDIYAKVYKERSYMPISDKKACIEAKKKTKHTEGQTLIKITTFKSSNSAKKSRISLVKKSQAKKFDYQKPKFSGVRELFGKSFQNSINSFEEIGRSKKRKIRFYLRKMREIKGKSLNKRPPKRYAEIKGTRKGFQAKNFGQRACHSPYDLKYNDLKSHKKVSSCFTKNLYNRLGHLLGYADDIDNVENIIGKPAFLVLKRSKVDHDSGKLKKYSFKIFKMINAALIVYTLLKSRSASENIDDD